VLIRCTAAESISCTTPWAHFCIPKFMMLRMLASQLKNAPSLARGMAAGRVIVGKERSRPTSKAVMQLTESAAKRISELLAKRREHEPVTAVRVGIKSRGCNGLSYTMNYATEKQKLEEEVVQHGKPSSTLSTSSAFCWVHEMLSVSSPRVYMRCTRNTHMMPLDSQRFESMLSSCCLLARVL